MQTKLLAPLMLLLLTLSPIHSAPAGKTYTVLIKGFRFEPERLEVAAGDFSESPPIHDCVTVSQTTFGDMHLRADKAVLCSNELR
jgi:hypothetical protein